MALFNRNKKTTIAELEEYYANQNTSDSSARAWAMAILSLIITVAVILALFFAGRWLWRVIDGNDEDANTTTQQEGVIVQEDGTLSGDLTLLDNSTTDGGSVSTDTSNDTDSAVDNSNEGVVSEEAASTDVSNDDSVAVLGDSEDTTDTGSTELPNTGAGTALLLIPAATAVAGYSASRRRQLNNR